MKSLKDTHQEFRYRLKMLCASAAFGASVGLPAAIYLFQQRFGQDNFDYLCAVLFSKLSAGQISGEILHVHGVTVNQFWGAVQSTPSMMDALQLFQNYLLVGGIAGALFCVSICLLLINKGEK